LSDSLSLWTQCHFWLVFSINLSLTWLYLPSPFLFLTSKLAVFASLDNPSITSQFYFGMWLFYLGCLELSYQTTQVWHFSPQFKTKVPQYYIPFPPTNILNSWVTDSITIFSCSFPRLPSLVTLSISRIHLAFVMYWWLLYCLWFWAGLALIPRFVTHSLVFGFLV
jgi:hypothetical protein